MRAGDSAGYFAFRWRLINIENTARTRARAQRRLRNARRTRKQHDFHVMYITIAHWIRNSNRISSERKSGAPSTGTSSPTEEIKMKRTKQDLFDLHETTDWCDRFVPPWMTTTDGGGRRRTKNTE